MRQRHQKFSIELTDPARKALGEIALRWGGISRVAAIEMMIRRVGHLPPFEEDAAPWFPRAEVATYEERRELLTEMMKPLVAEPEPEPEVNAEPEPEANAEPEVPEVPEGSENVPEPLVASVAGEEMPSFLPPRAPREFVRAWYDDGAPVWVQLLGADATNGLDLTAEQREALNEWQAGVDREAP